MDSLAAKRIRQQLSTVISHCQVTLFTVDTERKISMFEGALVPDSMVRENSRLDTGGRSSWFVGEDVYRVFSRLGSGDTLDFLQPVEEIFAGRATEGTRQHEIRKSHRLVFSRTPMRLLLIHLKGDRPYRFNFIPLWGKASLEKSMSYIEGVIGVATDVTEQKQREAALEEEAREKRQAISNETAAREANRLKSQFLANVRVTPLQHLH